MDKIDIEKWADIADQAWSSLLLGNGASIAIHSEFAYQTLHGIADAKGLLATTAPVFDKLGTTDFEYVLLACWYGEQVNVALGATSADIAEAYAEVRTALIEAVHSVHPIHSDVASDLRRVGAFASEFATVVSLNYDITFYWAMLAFNTKHGSWFKDAFHHGRFESDWEYLRKPYGQAKGATLVFYPHGNLALGRDCTGDEAKLAVTNGFSADLLDSITLKWTSKSHVPLFVSEGKSKQKVAAIRRSSYLTDVYQGVLSALEASLVVYGWSFDARDEHVLSAIALNAPERLAVSVFTAQRESEQQAFCHHVREAVSRVMPHTAVTFFDSQSTGCWNNP